MNNECPLCGSVVSGDECDCGNGAEEGGLWLVLFRNAMREDGVLLGGYYGFVCRDADSAAHAAGYKDDFDYLPFFAPTGTITAAQREGLLRMLGDSNSRAFGFDKLAGVNWHDFLSLTLTVGT